ncbi:hypothetical protein OH76DRAFT_1345164 [Lentinus brumalis]|uniref:F-box domain-containing protein n=1 Tax=Lentinus brumalis TaxID=2498619 RepID=A0A371DJ25_9APHY|nr:hypothetical protein OH76DRAFT_1345164 [Polyporus brumalis]
MRIPWEVMKSCLTRPRIISLSFDTPQSCLPAVPYPEDEVATIFISLSSFSFTTPLWRENLHEIYEQSDSGFKNLLALEAVCLSALVPRLNDTAEQLTLPMEATPMLSMLDRSWPKLQKLWFHGSYADATQMEALPLLISRLPRLEDLSVTVRQRDGPVRRAPILGYRSASNAPFRPANIRLRSLIVAYPDPKDDIFSVDITDLSHLSLRDYPRYYYNLTYHEPDNDFGTGSPAPILTNAECLSILRRMDMPRLTSLELVYFTDPGGADDELLSYICHAFPSLAHLQLHRYRADRDEHVDYERIARILTAARSLRTIRLNLDLNGDHGPCCNYASTIDAWLAKVKDDIGPRVIGVLQECPFLECCELLYHARGGSTWVEFRPPHCPEPHFIRDDHAHLYVNLMPSPMIL